MALLLPYYKYSQKGTNERAAYYGRELTSRRSLRFWLFIEYGEPGVHGGLCNPSYRDGGVEDGLRT